MSLPFPLGTQGCLLLVCHRPRFQLVGSRMTPASSDPLPQGILQLQASSTGPHCRMLLAQFPLARLHTTFPGLFPAQNNPETQE